MDSKPAISTLGSAAVAVEAKPAISTTASTPGRKSDSGSFSAEIEAGLTSGLSLKRIHQDLVSDHAFTGSYQSVKRFAHKFAASIDPPFRRIECAPGEEMQVDFGSGAWVAEDGRRRRPHLFRCVLSHSRKGYTEVVWRQTTETFMRCLENAFRHFGGVPIRVVIDNLKAGVLQADWFDPELNPKLVEFCRHYGTDPDADQARHAPAQGQGRGAASTTSRRTPSRAVSSRAWPSKTSFLPLGEIGRRHPHPRHRAPAGPEALLTAERPALRPLPAMAIPEFRGGPALGPARRPYRVQPRRTIRCRRSMSAAQVWVRAESRLVRVFSPEWSRSPSTPGLEPGRFATDPGISIPTSGRSIERGAEYLLGRCRLLGPALRRLGRGHVPPPRSLGDPQSPRPAASGQKASRPRHRAGRRARTGARLLPPARSAALAHRRPSNAGPARFPPGPSAHPRSVRLPHRFPTMNPTRLHPAPTAPVRPRPSLSVRLQEAAANRLGHAEFLELILQDELNVRQQRQMERRKYIARVPRA